MSIALPALNEEDVIAEVVGEITAVVEGRLADWELILIDDGSSDRTGAIMDELAAAHPKLRAVHNASNLGLGNSFKVGLREARFPYYMMLCGDGGFPAASLQPILARMGSVDVVVPAIDNLKEIKTPLRYAMSRCYTLLMNALFRQRLAYYNGLPLYRTALLRALTITSSGFAFQGEVLTKLLKAGCSYVEVPVPGEERTRRSSALRLGNLASIARTLLLLVVEMRRYDPAAVRRARAAAASDAGATPAGRDMAEPRFDAVPVARIVRPQRAKTL
ncbi:MAG: glycosyltransferase family 2 protein [Alphaproteobacteria bacterium]